MRYAPATSSVEGLGCAKTRACCGAVECGSQTPDVFASSREANDALPTSGQPQRSRKLGVSSTFRAQLPFTSMLPRVVNTRDQMAAAEKDSNGFCSVHVFTHPGSYPEVLLAFRIRLIAPQKQTFRAARREVREGPGAAAAATASGRGSMSAAGTGSELDPS